MSDSEYISFGGVLALRKPNEYRSNMIADAISVHSTRLPLQLKQKERNHFRSSFLLAGVVGFEPTDDGVRVHCLTTWLHPNNNSSSLAKKIPFCKFLCLSFSIYFAFLCILCYLWTINIENRL